MRRVLPVPSQLKSDSQPRPVNDSLLLLSRFNDLIREGKNSVSEAIVGACTGRLRAVMLTSVTTFAGLAPLLGETSMQAQFLIPAAAALGYGILFATVITLIPSLFRIQHDVLDGIKHLKSKFVTESQTHSPEQESGTLSERAS